MPHNNGNGGIYKSTSDTVQGKMLTSSNDVSIKNYPEPCVYVTSIKKEKRIQVNIHEFILDSEGQSECSELQFRPPGDESVQIYKGAPSGMAIAQIKAVDTNNSQAVVTYNILDVKDHLHFSIGPQDGQIINDHLINTNINHTYELLVIALANGQTEVKHVLIKVVRKNENPPKFKQPVYKVDLLLYADPGTPVVQVRAVDELDGQPKGPIVYRLDDSVIDQFLASEYFKINRLRGSIKVAKRLDRISARKLYFSVIAEDGGSPMLADTAKVVINIKTISVPVGIYASIPSETSLKFCWNYPEFGIIDGYNITFEKLVRTEKLLEDGEVSRINEIMIPSEARSLCYIIEDLEPWMEYKVSVFAWNKNEVGLVSRPQIITTRPDFCLLEICAAGSTCQLLNSPPGYLCHCDAGQYGTRCENYNACVENPCENFGKCSNNSDGSYICECQIGFYGRNCSDFNPCAQRDLSPCENGATCFSNDTNTYDCFCSEGFYGRTCDQYNPCVSYPCLNAGQCFNASDENFTCECQPGFEGEICEINIDECQSSPCSNNGFCVDGIEFFTCECEHGYFGNICEFAVDEIQTSYGNFLFPPVEHGMMIQQKCPFGSIDKYHQVFYRKCVLNKISGEVQWEKIDLSNCKQEGHAEAEFQSRELESITSNPNEITADRLEFIVGQCERIVEYAIKDKIMAVNLLSSISNLMEVNDSVLQAANSDISASERLVEVINWYTEHVVLEESTSMNINSKNIKLQVNNNVKERPDGAVLFRPNTTNSDFSHFSMKVPKEAIRSARNSFVKPRVKFVYYNTNIYFKENEIRETKDMYSLPVIEASINAASIRNMSSPIIYTLDSQFFNDNHVTECVYYIPEEKRWSAEGLITIQRNNKTTCYSSHMTAFSILMDPTPHEAISAKHSTILSFISYIGCLISVVGLIFTIVTYSMFRCLNKDRQGRILLNLCVSMLFMNLSFLLGALNKDGPFSVFSNTDICFIVSILLHYFLLTSLCWMCVEAINMYKLLVRVFTFSEPHFILKRCVAAWGAPAIVVGTTVGININYYRNNNEYCMLSPENPFVYFISFFGPCCLILLINLIVFIMVCRVLFSPRMTSGKNDMIKKRIDSRKVTAMQIKGAFTVMVLLGVTWVFGAFAIGKAKLVFLYIFTVCNSLQGFLIFVIRCLSYPEARKAWCHFFTTGQLKRYKGTRPTIASHTNSNSLQYKTSENGHNSVKTMNSDSTISTLVYNNSSSWGRGSKTSMKNSRKNSAENKKTSEKNGKPRQKLEDIENLYAKPTKKFGIISKTDFEKKQRGFMPNLNGTLTPPPVPQHMNFTGKSELERTLKINDLSGDSDVGMIDDITSDDDNKAGTPKKLPGRENWILKTSPNKLDDNDNSLIGGHERERDLCEVKRSNKLISKRPDKQRRMSLSSISSTKSASNLKRHTSIIMINKDFGDELKALSQSTPNILQCDEPVTSQIPPKPVFPECDVSSCHTNVINIKLGKKNKF
ncbi:Adhesion G-protein coupled receptor G6 [Nymphon striatum]|nr:Adhesion G-protein coupled receptor G6 [Nymphon striatum]